MTATAADSLLDGLNPQQRAAVVHEGSPLLIVAGAGSGKTRVLAHRIAYLLGERGVAPSEILAITFTNKAAGEMAARAAALTGSRARAMWLLTFHAACVRILRREARRFGYPSSFSIYDQADSQRLMTLVCRELDLDVKYFPPKAIAAQVSNLKNDLIDYETLAARATGYREKTLAEAYAEYQRRLVAAGAMDFDDLIMVTVNLLQAFPDVAAEYRARFRHLLVDEYQDTNHAQYVLVTELAGAQLPGADRGGEPAAPSPPAELCVVGDADQSIYAFRGATIRNIEEFERDFPGAQVILLEQNYRSTQNILAAANALVARNPGRVPKRLWSEAGDGPPITGYVADSEHDQAAFVAEEVDRLADEGLAIPGQVAVFYRTNAQSRVFEEVFIPGRPAVQGRRRSPVLRAARGPRPARLPAADRQRPRRGVAAAGAERAPAGHRRAGRGVRGGVRRAAEDQLRPGPGPRGRHPGPGRPVGPGHRGVRRADRRAPGERGQGRQPGRRPGRGGAGQDRVRGRAGDLLTDLQDESRIENLNELVSAARGVRRPAVRGPARRGVGRWRTSSSRCRWWPTPTRCRTARSTAAWSR